MTMAFFSDREHVEISDLFRSSVQFYNVGRLSNTAIRLIDWPERIYAGERRVESPGRELLCCWCDEPATRELVSHDDWVDPACSLHFDVYSEAVA